MDCCCCATFYPNSSCKNKIGNKFTFNRANLVISKADRGSWGPVGNPGGDLEPAI